MSGLNAGSELDDEAAAQAAEAKKAASQQSQDEFPHAEVPDVFTENDATVSSNEQLHMDLSALTADLKNMGGVNRTLAAEAIRLVPELGQRYDVDMYTTGVTRTLYTPTMEAIDVKKAGIVGGIVVAVLGILYGLFKWKFGKKNPTEQELDAMFKAQESALGTGEEYASEADGLAKELNQFNPKINSTGTDTGTSIQISSSWRVHIGVPSAWVIAMLERPAVVDEAANLIGKVSAYYDHVKPGMQKVLAKAMGQGTDSLAGGLTKESVEQHGVGEHVMKSVDEFMVELNKFNHEIGQHKSAGHKLYTLLNVLVALRKLTSPNSVRKLVRAGNAIDSELLELQHQLDKLNDKAAALSSANSETTIAIRKIVADTGKLVSLMSKMSGLVGTIYNNTGALITTIDGVFTRVEADLKRETRGGGLFRSESSEAGQAKQALEHMGKLKQTFKKFDSEVLASRGQSAL